MQKKNTTCLVVICQTINTITMTPYFYGVLVKMGIWTTVFYNMAKPNWICTWRYTHHRLECCGVIDYIFLFCIKNEWLVHTLGRKHLQDWDLYLFLVLQKSFAPFSSWQQLQLCHTKLVLSFLAPLIFSHLQSWWMNSYICFSYATNKVLYLICYKLKVLLVMFSKVCTWTCKAFPWWIIVFYNKMLLEWLMDLDNNAWE